MHCLWEQLDDYPPAAALADAGLDSRALAGLAERLFPELFQDDLAGSAVAPLDEHCCSRQARLDGWLGPPGMWDALRCLPEQQVAESAQLAVWLV